jgi:hypothetical protein
MFELWIRMSLEKELHSRPRTQTDPMYSTIHVLNLSTIGIHAFTELSFILEELSEGRLANFRPGS